jgi:hypothetical protein
MPESIQGRLSGAGLKNAVLVSLVHCADTMPALKIRAIIRE